MPILGSHAAASIKSFGLTVLAALSFITDTFNRANNTANLGSVGGQAWKIVRGAWQILSNKASSSSTAGTNALATLSFTKNDVTVSISGPDPGMGAAFWVTDADNWYASVYTQTQTCQTCSNCNAWNSPTCVSWATGNCTLSGTFCCGTFNTRTCNSWTLGSCNSWTLGNCTVWNSANTGNKNAPFGFCFGPSRNPSTCNSRNPSNCNSWNSSNCNALCCNGAFVNWSPYCTSNSTSCNSFFTFSCNCTTQHRVSILRSLVGSVTTLSNNLFSGAIQSFRTALSGSQATISAFSTTTYNSQIGNSVVTNISSPIKSSRHGIIKSTSPLNQGSAIDEFGAS